ncbi:PilX N-terminal domain-containing pilus assembly protein [Cupriavidus taiwanensis]|nr:pilus assembly PilX N-terminal domain-containing protein [Cupriavidus taiwanensis]SOY87343.1 putative pilin biogenesis TRANSMEMBRANE PROTEIN (pilin operon) [Cupriavidus taiwanensis]SOZ04187.1 putative pilin biogenesis TRANSMEMBRANE PROTEIN (pilin operon) [Cupriavidus taiwanensis]SPC08829.1 putative pilin biogenesis TRANSMEMBRANE PROTEIN (pilin operon) [Cupriavidus taiwanensis]SPD38620.1 putative pilin biogenesis TRANSMEMBRANE PROTEIN (Pilin operon) [Cupriavidus taiwanensis]
MRTTIKSTGGALRRSQSGVTLVVTLVFMVMFLMIAVAMVNSGLINVKVASNQQHSAEARDVAQQAIEQVISDDFTKAPVAVDVPVDVTGDGTADYVAQVAVPACVTSKPVAKVIDPEKHPEDAECTLGSSTGNGNLVVGPGGANVVSSLCNDTQWDVAATVNDANTGTVATVHQGVAVRTLYGSTCP